MLALGLKDQVPQFVDIRPRTEWQGNADMFYPNPYLEPIDWEAIKKAYLEK
jgi:ribose transport system substrate-binding protein